MDTSFLPANIELLANGMFTEQWMPEGPAAKWEMNEAGELVQTLAVGTRKGGTGALVVQKLPVSSAVQELRLTCRPGAQHQVGVVFNLVDDKNFCAFCVDSHDKKSKGYDLLAFSVTAGNYDVISKQSYTEELPETVTLILRQVEMHLALVFNDERSYTWKNNVLFGRKIGLYSYRNTDAAFLSLSHVPVLAAPVSAGPLTPPETPAVIAVSQEAQIPASVIPGNEVTGFLDIRPPASRTELEFMEVFTVPLDSFYSSFYDSIRDGNMQPAPGGNSEVELLDLRVKRWYRELKAVRKDITAAMKDLVRKQGRIAKAEEQLAAEQDDKEYGLLEDKLEKCRGDEKKVAQRINELHDREGLLLREIRINGYALVEDTTNDAIRELGYDFHLVGQAITRGEYDPAEFDAQLDLSKDEAWEDALKKLHQHLFDTDAITDIGISLYEQEKSLLTNFNSCPSLVEVQQQLREDIERQESIRPFYESEINSIESEIAEWEEDKLTLLKQKEAYSRITNSNSSWPYNSDYVKLIFNKSAGWFNTVATPTISNVLYPAHPYFQESFFAIGKGRRMKLNKFVADVYAEFSDVRVSGNVVQYANTELIKIAQGLALYCPEINVNFYHRVESVYFIGTYPVESYDPRNYEMRFVLGPRDRNEYGTTQNILDFFTQAQKVCDYFLDKANVKLETAKLRLRELVEKKTVFRNRLEDILQNGIARKRLLFIERWNDPATNLTASIATTVHYPDEDPMAEFLSSVSGHNSENANPVDTYFFAPTPDGFYNQNGLSLHEFMKTRPSKTVPKALVKGSQRDVICVFPVFDSTGNISTEMVKSVKNPEPSTKDAALPTIKFVETYRIEVGWLGYGLGELSHSFNLFPGESKELVVEKSTKLSTKLSETSASEASTATHLTSSFEDNLQNEFSVGEKAAQDSSSALKKDASQSSSAEDTSSSESTTTSAANVQASVSGGMFGFNASVSGGASSSSSGKSSASSKRNSALAASQSAEEKKASNQSKDVLAKNVSNAVRKVASDTSQNNKLSFTAVSSREYEASTSNRETIKLQNPNVGKTVNYNFFQVQNQFGVMVKLADVQIVIDSGVEMVKGTGINDVRVHTLEEFGKIYANSDGSDHSAALAAIVARQVLKHYGDFLPGVTSGNGSVTVRDGIRVDKEMLQVLNFSTEDGGGDPEERMNRIKTALSYLKGIPFIFREKKLSEEATVAVNCAAYHVEAQLGFKPATETYLEDRREIETEKQRALVEHVKAQTKAGVFFQELPVGVTTLNVAGLNVDRKKEEETT